jgi:hypothetical protein
MAKNKTATLTTASGSSIADNQNALTVDPCGPLSVQEPQHFYQADPEYGKGRAQRLGLPRVDAA